MSANEIAPWVSPYICHFHSKVKSFPFHSHWHKITQKCQISHFNFFIDEKIVHKNNLKINKSYLKEISRTVSSLGHHSASHRLLPFYFTLFHHHYHQTHTQQSVKKIFCVEKLSFSSSYSSSSSNCHIMLALLFFFVCLLS